MDFAEKAKKADKVYDIGLDIGTNSVGWSVVDENGRMLRFKGKNMWGVRLFDTAQTKAERRMFRSVRRRLGRRRQRVLHLQDLMAEDVLRADESFYHRLKESALISKDKTFAEKFFALPSKVFENEQNIDVARKYPTIYHLRKALCENPQKADIRYVYLALHHIIKYRGNFLYEGQAMDKVGSDTGDLIRESLTILFDEQFSDSISDAAIASVMDEIKKRNKSNKDKVKDVLAAFGGEREYTTALDAWARAVLGMSFAWEKLTQAEVPAAEQLKITLSDETAEEELFAHDPNNAQLVDVMMMLFRWAMFSRLRRDNETLSMAMVRKYEEHKQDKLVLKRLLRTHYPENGQALYKRIFKDKTEKKMNYHNYCNNSGHCARDKFFAFLKKELGAKAKALENNPDYQYVMQRMGEQNEGDFLHLQRNRDNGVIPNQFHVEELRQIIRHQAAYYPSLREHGDKIVDICRFRIPYYVGPLNRNSPFAWMERREAGKIYPWNFEDKVDLSLSAEKFMENLRKTSTCTYLPAEYVLPRFSPLYQEYCLLDELNKVRIVHRDGLSRLLTVPEKQRMVEDLFLSYKKVTKKAAIRWLAAQGVGDIDNLTGLRKEDGEAFEGTLSTMIDFAKIGLKDIKPKHAEEIVYWVATFQDRRMIAQKLQKYDFLTEEQARYLSQRQYKGWGRLSHKLLDGIQGVYRGQRMTVIEVMRQSDLNFMQIIHDKNMMFGQRLDEENAKENRDDKITLEDIHAIPCSPALYRSIWQTVQILDEIRGIMKTPPRAVYLEVTREDDPRKKGKKPESRIERVEKIYREQKLDEALHQELKQYIQEGKNLDNERVLLYYLQNGKCLYTGEPLDINHLYLYHVDHIVPRSFKKDDSLNNKALITSAANQAKLDSLVVPQSMRDRQYHWWNRLRQTGLMSEQKFRSLTRSGYQEEELAGFLNRQLVETSQMIQHIVSLLKTWHPAVKAQSVKSRLVSDLREQYGFHKLREVNDYHHAFDALLCAVLGQFQSEYLSWLDDDAQASRQVRLYRQNRNYKSNHGIALGFFSREMTNPKTGEIHYPGRAAGYLSAAYGYKDCFITRKTDINMGSFYDQMPLKAAKEKLHPRKKGLDIASYGGYASPSYAYMTIIEYTNSRGKKARGLEGVPVLYAESIGDSEEKLLAYFASALPHCRQIAILCPKVPVNQLARYEGHLIWLRSPNEAWNACQLLLDRESLDYAAAILKGLPLPAGGIGAAQFMERFRQKLLAHYPRYQGIAAKMSNFKTDWALVGAEEMRAILRQLFLITSASGATGDFSKIDQLPDLKSRQGRMKSINFNLDNLVLIDQSVTGMFEGRNRRFYGVSHRRHPDAL